MKFPGFVGGTYESYSPNFDAERSVNLFVERIESGSGKNAAGLLTSPGLRNFTTGIQGPIRAMLTDPHSYPSEDRVFAIGGNKFYEIFSDGSSTVRGTVSDDGNHFAAFMASNAPVGRQIAIADGYQGLYIYNLDTNNFTGPISDTGSTLVRAIAVVHIDGYFLANTVSTSGATAVQFSSLNDGLTWDPLDFFSPETNPLMIVADHRELWIFGDHRIKIYVNTGDADNPWQPAAGGDIQQGCNAPATPVKLDNSIYWIGKDPERGANVVWRAEGYLPKRVSNHAVEKALEAYPANTNVLTHGYGFVMHGHAFYHLGFEVGDASWRYDAATGLWHEVGYWDTAEARYRNHLSRVHTYAWGKHLVGGRTTSSGTIYEMKMGLADDAGNPQRWLRRAPHLSEENKRITHHSFEVDFEAGLAGAGEDPYMQLRFSNNGGKTWSNERTASMGETGEYGQRAKFNRLGQARDRVYELSGTAPIRIVNAYLELTPGNS